jgi:hypothetical protein
MIIMGTILLANLDNVYCASVDLALEYFTWEPEHPVSGGPLSIHVRINNAGDTISSDKYVVSLYIDDEWIDGWFARLVNYQPPVNPRVAPGRPEVWHFSISDHAILKQGDHQIKAVVTDPSDQNPNNNELVKTLSINPGNYSSDFNIINYGMCSRIDQEKLPVNITDSYGVNDEVAVSYAYTDIKHADWSEEMGKEGSLIFRLYSPNGTLHRERGDGYSILFATDPNGREITGFAFQLFINKDLQAYGKKGDPSYDPGYEALGKFPGIWRVELFSYGHLLFLKRFIIEEASSHTSSTATLSESTLGNEQTPTTYGQEDQVLGGYLTVAGAIVIVAVMGAILLKRKKRQPSVSPSSKLQDSKPAQNRSYLRLKPRRA